MSVYSPTEPELTKAFDDIFYEIQQLALMTVLSTAELGLNNAILESRLLHVRNLLDFFEHGPRSQDDVLAVHYGFGPSEVKVDPELRDRLNKDLAHLTYSRTHRTPHERAWPSAGIVSPLLDRCQSLVEHLLGSRSSFGEHGAADWEKLSMVLRQVRGALSGHKGV